MDARVGKNATCINARSVDSQRVEESLTVLVSRRNRKSKSKTYLVVHDYPYMIESLGSTAIQNN